MKTLFGVFIIFAGLIIMLAGMGNAIDDIIPVKESLEWLLNLTGIILGLFILIIGACIAVVAGEVPDLFCPKDASDYMAEAALSKKKK